MNSGEARVDEFDVEGVSTIPETNKKLKTSTSTTYRLIEDGKLEAIKIGNATRIKNRSIRALIAGSPPLVIKRNHRRHRENKAA